MHSNGSDSTAPPHGGARAWSPPSFVPVTYAPGQDLAAFIISALFLVIPVGVCPLQPRDIFLFLNRSARANGSDVDSQSVQDVPSRMLPALGLGDRPPEELTIFAAVSRPTCS